jgi:hypothetical protein
MFTETVTDPNIMADHTVLNPNNCTNNNNYLLFRNVPHTCFGPYKPSSRIPFTKEYAANKWHPRCVYMKLKYRVIN